MGPMLSKSITKKSMAPETTGDRRLHETIDPQSCTKCSLSLCDVQRCDILTRAGISHRSLRKVSKHDDDGPPDDEDEEILQTFGGRRSTLTPALIDSLTSGYAPRFVGVWWGVLLDAF